MTYLIDLAIPIPQTLSPVPVLDKWRPFEHQAEVLNTRPLLRIEGLAFILFVLGVSTHAFKNDTQVYYYEWVLKIDIFWVTSFVNVPKYFWGLTRSHISCISLGFMGPEPHLIQWALRSICRELAWFSISILHLFFKVKIEVGSWARTLHTSPEVKMRVVQKWR